MNWPQYTLKQNGQPLFTGNEWDVREKIEELLEEHIGFFVSLQEFTDDGEYLFYLHSDNDLEEEELHTLNEVYGISTLNDEKAQAAMMELLHIAVEAAPS